MIFFQLFPRELFQRELFRQGTISRELFPGNSFERTFSQGTITVIRKNSIPNQDLLNPWNTFKLTLKPVIEPESAVRGDHKLGPLPTTVEVHESKAGKDEGKDDSEEVKGLPEQQAPWPEIHDEPEEDCELEEGMGSQNEDVTTVLSFRTHVHKPPLPKVKAEGERPTGVLRVDEKEHASVEETASWIFIV